MHSNYFAYESESLALKGQKENSANCMTLNGLWKFFWVKDADMRSTDFSAVSYNDEGWSDMPVPGMWELNGFGDPVYVSQGYAWSNQFRNNPPEVPVENNHVGSYRKEITIPLTWKGKEIIAHFGSVTSNIYLRVNGQFAGYCEDSKLEAEFNLTKFLKPGKNIIAFQVFRWCDGTYLEDQDFTRFCGVGRDCYLYTRNSKKIQDIRVTTDLDEQYTNADLKIKVNVTGSAAVNLKLLDDKGNVVKTADVKGSGELVSGESFRIEFDRRTGFICKYDIDGIPMLNEGGALTPNFWRAPTDNDMGAGLQRKYVVWKNPELKLKSLRDSVQNNQVTVKAIYDIPAVSAKFYLTYIISNTGSVRVTEKMEADKSAKISDMFRFGMQLQMPEDFDRIKYYGRGPLEYYSDRKRSADLGKYSQTVDEQFYPYIRPQETGTKTDIRWWQQMNMGGKGIRFTAETPFSASALHYSIESLDDGPEKD